MYAVPAAQAGNWPVGDGDGDGDGEGEGDGDGEGEGDGDGDGDGEGEGDGDGEGDGEGLPVQGPRSRQTSLVPGWLFWVHQRASQVLPPNETCIPFV
uniref:hypothetical protein n=1 Tax=Acrocarpospora macrocephala TaxID=150177 RepID=UPI0035A234D1